MKIHLSLIPQEIIDEYDVMKYAETDGYIYIYIYIYIYVEITGAMYGLSQSGRIANQDLQKHLGQNMDITQQNVRQAYGNIKQD